MWPWRMPRDLPWKTPYPLPRDTSEALLAEGRCDNFGLLQEKYLAYGSQRGQIQLLRELNDRQALVPDFAPERDLLEAYRARWEQLATAEDATTFQARPEWRVVIGLGTNDLLRSGMALHPIFAFPVIPASALKGISRSYARWVMEETEESLEPLFGSADDNDQRRGDLHFLEGIPANAPLVERDVVSPVFGAYYRDEKVPPAGFLSPQPTFFLAIGAASVYWFGVASLSGDANAVLKGVEWLKGALTQLGVGAKTAAGYGYWEVL